MTAADSPPHRGLRRRTVAWLVAVAVVIAVAVAMALVHLPFAIFRPGPAWNTLGKLGGHELITIKGTRTYPSTGALDFVTVTVYGGPNNPVNVWDVLTAKLSGNAEIFPEKEIFPNDLTGKQVEHQNELQMVHSQEEAAVVALRALGKTVPERIVIVEVQQGSDAQGLLRKGDVIVGVAGQPVKDVSDVQRLVQAQRPGSTVAIKLRRQGHTRTVHVPTHESDGRTVVGVLLTADFDLPFAVNIDAGNVGGPSAGMMFSLGVYDKLTPGSLTGGKRFAGTGTIDSSGEVGPIGGIAQKMVGARDDGAHWFLAPAKNCDDVVGHVPDGLQVVKVSTFDGARRLVKQIAAGRTSGLPRCTAPAGGGSG